MPVLKARRHPRGSSPSIATFDPATHIAVTTRPFAALPLQAALPKEKRLSNCFAVEYDNPTDLFSVSYLLHHTPLFILSHSPLEAVCFRTPNSLFGILVTSESHTMGVAFKSFRETLTWPICQHVNFYLQFCWWYPVFCHPTRTVFIDDINGVRNEWKEINSRN